LKNNKIEEMQGVVNASIGSEDFLKEYCLVDYIDLVIYEKIAGDFNSGVFLKTDVNNSKCVFIPLSAKSYLNFKFILENHLMHVFNSYSLINLISNFYDIEILGAFVVDCVDDFFESYIFIGKDGDYSCINIVISDVLCLNSMMEFPIYINKEIVRSRGLNYSKIQKFLKEQNSIARD